MQHPVNLEVSPDLDMYPELGHVRALMSNYFANEEVRTVKNSTVSLGRGCGFEGGSFLMGVEHAAPNEPDGQAYEYVMKDNDGVIICVREKSSLLSNQKAAPSDSSTKRWQFWK